MAGHSHLYQRGKSKADNITYMIVGGGGGELEKKNERVADYNIYNVTYFGYHYVVMTLTKTCIHFTTYNLTNHLIDQFELPFAKTS